MVADRSIVARLSTPSGADEIFYESRLSLAKLDTELVPSPGWARIFELSSPTTWLMLSMTSDMGIESEYVRFGWLDIIPTCYSSSSILAVNMVIFYLWDSVSFSSFFISLYNSSFSSLCAFMSALSCL